MEFSDRITDLLRDSQAPHLNSPIVQENVARYLQASLVTNVVCVAERLDDILDKRLNQLFSGDRTIEMLVAVLSEFWYVRFHPGAGCRDRTGDWSITNRLLYQLR